MREWLDDCPYPRALVESHRTASVVADATLLASTTAAVRSLRNLHSEMNPDSCVERDCVLSSDPAVRTWQLCAMTPMATLDQLKLLSIDRDDERLVTLAEICCERYGDMMRQLELARRDED